MNESDDQGNIISVQRSERVFPFKRYINPSYYFLLLIVMIVRFVPGKDHH